jgi:hypothetical protein
VGKRCVVRRETVAVLRLIAGGAGAVAALALGFAGGRGRPIGRSAAEAAGGDVPNAGGGCHVRSHRHEPLSVEELDHVTFARARRGDEAAFAALVRHYDTGLRSLAYRLLGDRARMDDALQEAYRTASDPDRQGRQQPALANGRVALLPPRNRPLRRGHAPARRRRLDRPPRKPRGLHRTPTETTLSAGALAGTDAQFVISAHTVPHLWALGERLVVTVGGDLTRAQLVRIADSLELR